MPTGLRLTFSYGTNSREFRVQQLIYQVISFSIGGIERGSGYGPSWDKIETILPEFGKDDIPILINMIDKSIDLSHSKNTDISFSITWVLSRLDSDEVVKQLNRSKETNGKSYYIDYAIELAKWNKERFQQKKRTHKA